MNDEVTTGIMTAPDNAIVAIAIIVVVPLLLLLWYYQMYTDIGRSGFTGGGMGEET